MSPGKSKLISHNLNQTAVYWGEPVSDGIGGRTFGLDYPIEISVRWEQRQELFINALGQEVRSQAIVFVDRDIDVGGYLYLGELSDLSSTEEGDPLSIEQAYEIRAFSKVPGIKAQFYVRKVWV